MRVMVLVKASEESEAGIMPDEEMLTEMGKFNEELVAGFWLWKVESMDEAVEWLERAPFDGGAEVEIRRVFETEDFGEERYLRLRSDGRIVHGRFEEGGPEEPLFRVRDDGRLEPVAR